MFDIYTKQLVRLVINTDRFSKTITNTEKKKFEEKVFLKKHKMTMLGVYKYIGDWDNNRMLN